MYHRHCLVLSCRTIFHPDYSGQDCPSTSLDNLLNLIYLATEVLSDSVEFIGTIQINLSIYRLTIVVIFATNAYIMSSVVCVTCYEGGCFGKSDWIEWSWFDESRCCAFPLQSSGRTSVTTGIHLIVLRKINVFTGAFTQWKIICWIMYFCRS